MSLVETVFDMSRQIKDGRSVVRAAASVSAEVGELWEEISIEHLGSYRKPDADGIVGEAIDVIISALDVIYLSNPEMTEQEITDYANKKLLKWKSSIT